MKFGMIGRSVTLMALTIAMPALAGQEVRQQPPGTSRSDAEGVPRGSGDDIDPPSAAIRDKNGRPSTGDAKYDAGMAAIRAKQPARAVELMRPVLADFEKRYAGEKREIFCAVTPAQSARYLADAAKTNRAAVAIEPGWCRAQYVTGYALIDLAQLTEAQAAFERLVQFAPQNARYLNELGYILMKQKKWQESADIYRRADVAADLSPDTNRERCLALKGVGYNLVELGDLTAAAAAYRKCLAIDPTDADSPRELQYIEKQRKLTV